MTLKDAFIKGAISGKLSDGMALKVDLTIRQAAGKVVSAKSVQNKGEPLTEEKKVAITNELMELWG
jgi:hypothetical protein